MTVEAVNRLASPAAGEPLMVESSSHDGGSGIDDFGKFISFAIGDDQYGVESGMIALIDLSQILSVSIGEGVENAKPDRTASETRPTVPSGQSSEENCNASSQ